MTRNEFLQRLEAGLANVTPDERVAALQFYTEYFDDAGIDREAAVLAELGDVDKLAADLCAVSGVEVSAPQPQQQPQPEIVLTAAPAPQPQQPAVEPQPAPAGIPNTDSGAAFGMGAAPEAPQPEYQFPGGYVPPQYQMVQQPGVSYGNQPQPQYNQRNTGIAILAVVLLIIFAAPIGGIAASILAILCVPFVVGFALAVAAIGVAIAGVALMATTVANGLIFLGIALAMGAGGIALIALGVKIVAWGGKAVARGIRAIWRGITGKREGAYA